VCGSGNNGNDYLYASNTASTLDFYTSTTLQAITSTSTATKFYHQNKERKEEEEKVS
jgi:NAD(P)H-hydrate repair Nnr-like enzyme with NAD(P)H-hydrate epimerase domain